MPQLSQSDLAIVASRAEIDSTVPTKEEMQTLRHVSDKIPIGAWLVAIVALTERFAYYGVVAPLQNYMQNARDDPLRPGALGLGQSKATSLFYFFNFFAYITAFLGAVVADAYLGRYKSLCLFISIYVIGILILFATSLPNSLAEGAGFGGLITAMVIIGVGVGGTKSSLAPFMADQCSVRDPLVLSKTNKGEKVIIDQALTLESIYSIFYWCVNVGSLSGIATTWIEKKTDFWAAYLLPLCFIWVAVGALLIGRTKFVDPPPQGSILPWAFKAFWYGLGGGCQMDAAKQNVQFVKHQRVVPWDDTFIDELKQGLLACRVFIAFPVLLLCQSQLSNNLVSQAGTMQTHGVPNDILGNLNPISVIILLPIVQRLVYPALRKWKIVFTPLNKMALGFLLEASAMAYAAGVQQMIYNSGPCFNAPLKCAASANGTIPNNINVIVQAPIYVLEGLGEIFSSPSSYEYAYTKAPPSMKSLVQSVLISTAAVGSLMGLALAPAYHDPWLVAPYAGLSGFMAVTAAVFLVVFRNYNRIEQADDVSLTSTLNPTSDVAPDMAEKALESGHEVHKRVGAQKQDGEE